jgi:hypothetical protein
MGVPDALRRHGTLTRPPSHGSHAVTRVGHPEAGAGSLDVLDVYDDHVLCVASAPDTPPRVVVRRPDPSRDVDKWVNVTVCAPLRGMSAGLRVH